MQIIFQILIVGIMLSVPLTLAVIFTFFPEKVIAAMGKTGKDIIKDRLDIHDKDLTKFRSYQPMWFFSNPEVSSSVARERIHMNFRQQSLFYDLLAFCSVE